MQKVNAKGRSVQKWEWKETDGQTDRRTEAIALPPVLTRSVKSCSLQNHASIALDDRSLSDDSKTAPQPLGQGQGFFCEGWIW